VSGSISCVTFGLACCEVGTLKGVILDEGAMMTMMIMRAGVCSWNGHWQGLDAFFLGCFEASTAHNNVKIKVVGLGVIQMFIDLL
jgi:hypothetical protein